MSNASFLELEEKLFQEPMTPSSAQLNSTFHQTVNPQFKMAPGYGKQVFYRNDSVPNMNSSNNGENLSVQLQRAMNPPHKEFRSMITPY